MRPIIFSAFTTCMLLCSSNIYAQQNKIIRGHLYEVSYPTQQPKDTMGRPTIYMPDAKSDMDRVVQPGQLPQYVTPLYYGYKEIKHNGSAEANTSQKPSTPRYGEEVSKRTATKNSFAIHHSDGIYHYREGIFYLQKGDKYEIHAPHVGFRVPNIPEARREYKNGDVAYYYYYGTFYVFNPRVKMYDVAEPPVGAVVDWIPEDAEKKVVDGESFHVANGVRYKESSMSVGTMKWYEVVGRE